MTLWYNVIGDFMSIFDGLNKEQKQAVQTNAKHVRVIAGAGSGKTRVLTTRIAHLVEEKGYNPKKICAITFTNKAANEMKDRIESMLAPDVGIFVSTIHALCVRIIREEYEALSLVRNFTILDQTDQQTILKEAYNEYGLQRKELSYRDVLNYISNNKMAQVSIKQAYKMAGSNYYETQKAKVYDYYVNRLKDIFALDFDDLLLKVDVLFSTNEKVRTKWQHRFNVILVDEFQDVDNIQYRIVDNLVGHENELYVVGDPDQTIYTWRGANVDNILHFDKTYPKAETITLHENYRSTQNILYGANRLIQFNPDRLEKDLHSNKGAGEPVIYAQRDDETDEAHFVVSQIKKLHEEGVSYLDMAILYRSNYLSRSFEKILTNLHIPYVIFGGLRFYDRQEIKDVMSYLRMVSHGDDLALRRSIAAPRRGVGEKTLETVFEQSKKENTTMYEVMKNMKEENKGSKRVHEYVALIESFKDYYETNRSIEDLMVKVFAESGLRKEFDKKEEIERIENVKSLMGEAIEFEKYNEDASLEDYVQMVSLYGDKQEVLEGDYIRLMTVHAAKGLEFDTVFLVGMNDRVFPNQNSMKEGREGLAEERRLAYVAITRAMHRLIITSNAGFNYVMGVPNRASRFIQEMGYDERVETAQDKKIKEPRIKPRANARYKPADVVVHDDFGEGIVLSVDGASVKIAFNYPFGTRTILKQFAGLRLKGDLT